MFDAIKARRHFNFKRLRDMAQKDGLEVRWLRHEGSRHRVIGFAISEGARQVFIHDSRSVPQAWEFFRGWKAGCRWGREVANPEP
jgi:hypothetical protein